MRLGKLLAVTGAAVASACAVVAAQEGVQDPSSGFAAPAPRRTSHYFSRSGQNGEQTVAASTPVAATGRPMPVPGVPNYYDRLFGPAAPASAQPIRTAGAEAESESSRLTHARYDRLPGTPDDGDIRQVSAGSTPSFGASPNPFAPNPFAATAEPAPTPKASAPAAAPSALPAAGPSFGPAMTRPAAAPATRSATLRPADRAPSGPSPDLRGRTVSKPASESHVPAKVEVRWERDGDVNVGKECRCQLVVTNSGDGPAGDVVVEAFFPNSVRLTHADPKPASTGEHLSWTFPMLPAGAEKRIAVTMIPNEQGDLQVAAYVRFTEAAATTFTVREPMLELAVSGPERVALGETASQTVTVSNPGTGTAENVVIEAILPPGLEHARGGKLSMTVGSIAGGESQVIRLALVATQGGPQPIQIRALSGDLQQAATANVFVAAANLKVAADGPGVRYVGRDAVYRVRVTNDGGAAANNVRVTHAVPDGFTFARADHGGRYESDAGQIVWYLGRIEAGQAVDLAAELTAAKLGTHRHLIAVHGEQGAKSEANVITQIDGTASLAIEVVDLHDPVEVGAEAAYEIRVRNEGTKAAGQVDVACSLPAGVVLVSAKGPTAHRVEGGTVAFAPVAELGPGKAAVYRVIARGTTAGDHRLQVRLSSDSVTQPLIHQELTHFYAD